MASCETTSTPDLEPQRHFQQQHWNKKNKIHDQTRKTHISLQNNQNSSQLKLSNLGGIDINIICFQNNQDAEHLLPIPQPGKKQKKKKKKKTCENHRAVALVSLRQILLETCTVVWNLLVSQHGKQWLLWGQQCVKKIVLDHDSLVFQNVSKQLQNQYAVIVLTLAVRFPSTNLETNKF